LNPYPSQLIEKLVAVLSHGAHTSNHNVQEMALSAIASTAAAAAADFAPYVTAVRACGHNVLQKSMYACTLCAACTCVTLFSQLSLARIVRYSSL